MKAKLIKEEQVVNPKWSAARAERARLAGRAYLTPPQLPAPAGTVIDHPDAFRLVQMGVAIPADEACRAAAGMTEEEMAHAHRRYLLLEKGLGYDEDGNELDFDEIELDDEDESDNPQ